MQLKKIEDLKQLFYITFLKNKIMKSLNLITLLIALITSVSCNKKKYPESNIENEPTFVFSGMINNQLVTLKAGINNYYIQSTYIQNSSNVYGFIANFSQQDCAANCPNSLSIQINSNKVVPLNSLVNIDSALFIGQYSYLSGALSNSYTVQFQSTYNKIATSYFWDFGDGQFSTLANPVHTFKFGSYTTCLSVTSANGCVSRLCQKQNFNFLSSNCTTSIFDSNLSAKTKQFNQTTSGTAPYSYLWSFGDGVTSTLANPIHTYTFSGSYPVSLRVIDATSDTAVANYNAVTLNDSSSCAVNYNTSSIQQISNQLALSTIVITWIDAMGNTYTSNNLLQPATSKFELLSVSDYTTNEANQSTKKLHIKFSCMVYNGTNALPISNAEAIICVAYK